jgi:hypothetical protein
MTGDRDEDIFTPRLAVRLIRLRSFRKPRRRLLLRLPLLVLLHLWVRENQGY